mgnify:CR=1 FL=1
MSTLLRVEHLSKHFTLSGGWFGPERRLDALTEQSRALRTQLHEEGLARAEPETLIPLSDGRFAMLTPEGANALHGWMYSDAFDEYVDAQAGAEFAEWTMDACQRLRSEWRVAWPPPTVSCAAALLARAGEERREACLPPFGRLAGILVSAPERAAAQAHAAALRRAACNGDHAGPRGGAPRPGGAREHDPRGKCEERARKAHSGTRQWPRNA